MCLAVIAWQTHPDYPLILLANRDEFYARGTRPAAWWGQSVSLLAGHDEEAGGTWFGINRQGRFALVTNVRAPTERNPHAPSRGQLVVKALQSEASVDQWMNTLHQRAQAFNGFNLLVGQVNSRSPQSGGELSYYSNRSAAFLQGLVDGGADTAPRSLDAGIYGLSNALLDTPWPKVTQAVTRFACQVAQRVDHHALLHLMADRDIARDDQLPSTGIPLDWERALSVIQVRANGYGTRSTTLLTVRSDGLVNYLERSFDGSNPVRFTDRHYEFTVDAANSTNSVRDSSR